MFSVSPTFAWGKLTTFWRLWASLPGPCMVVEQETCLLHTARAPSYCITFNCCHTEMAICSPICLFHLPWDLILISESWCGQFTQSPWVSLWTLTHWSEPIKFTENQILNPNVLPQFLRAVCSSVSVDNYHLLSQEPLPSTVLSALPTQHQTSCNWKCGPRTSRNLQPHLSQVPMNQNLHYFKQRNSQVKTWVQVLAMPLTNHATLIFSPVFHLHFLGFIQFQGQF